ncbi:ribosomal protein L5 domain-containing protein [Syncephalis fuscata]|nr:ribosomal protein L5 domain-containing protein [Syncephalis fuscata]
MALNHLRAVVSPRLTGTALRSISTLPHATSFSQKAKLEQAKEAATALEPEPKPKRNAAYTIGETPKRRGVRPKHPERRPQTHTSQPELERVIVHCQTKDASNAAPWHLREGMPFGCKVELRGEKMYSFVETLTEIVLPRIKEWRVLRGGSGDGLGNIALGFPSHVMGLFPEIEEVYDRIPRLSGFEINFITTAQTNWEARLLLSGLGMPFQPRRSQIRAMLGEAAPNKPTQ